MWKYIFLILALTLIGAGVWYGARAVLPVPVDVITPARGLAVQAVYATGTVEPTVMIPIASRVTARLSALNVDEGAQVKKGQILALLDDSDLQNTVAQLIAIRTLAQQNYDRAVVLVKQGAQNRTTLDQTLSNLHAAQANVAKAEVAVNDAKLIAPDEGIIIQRDGEIGQLIPANTPVIWMSCCAPLRVTTEVDEEDVARVRPGQDVLIQADAFPDQVFHGTVDAITPKGDPVARSYRVRVKFKEGEKIPFLIGMTAETNITVEHHDNALLIPTSALKSGVVWVLKEGRAHTVKVKVGASDVDRSEILEGLDDSTQVIHEPKLKLKEGERVSPHSVAFKASS